MDKSFSWISSKINFSPTLLSAIIHSAEKVSSFSYTLNIITFISYNQLENEAESDTKLVILVEKLPESVCKASTLASSVVSLVDIEDDIILISGCDNPATLKLPKEPVDVAEPLMFPLKSFTPWNVAPVEEPEAK